MEASHNPQNVPSESGGNKIIDLIISLLQFSQLKLLLKPYIIGLLDRLFYFKGYKIRKDLENQRFANLIAFEKSSQDLTIIDKSIEIDSKLQATHLCLPTKKSTSIERASKGKKNKR